jgi:uncharacterized protein YkwD
MFGGTWRVVLLAAVAAAALAAPASPATDRAQTRVSSVSSLESAVLVEVNALRRRHGLVPLRLSPQLSTAAASHSRAMASRGFFAHRSADGSTFWQRVRRFYPLARFRYWSVGENLLWSASPDFEASDAVRMWLESPPHRRNLLNSRWREVGLSAVFAPAAPGRFGGAAVTIVTANFGVRR